MPSHMETAASNARNRRAYMARGAVVCFALGVILLHQLFTRTPYAGQEIDGISTSSTSSSARSRSGNFEAGGGGDVVEYSWSDMYTPQTYTFLKYPAPPPAAGSGISLLQPYCAALQSRYSDAAGKNSVLAVHARNSRSRSSSSSSSGNNMPSSMPAYLDTFPKTASASEKRAATQALLRQYTQEHSRQAMGLDTYKYAAMSLDQRLRADIALCRSNRSFIIGIYSCPQQIGNRVHEFLNAFAAAVVTNRTLIWKFCDRPACSNKAIDCSPFLRLAPSPYVSPTTAAAAESWIPDAATVVTRLRNGGCEYPAYKYRHTGTKPGTVRSSTESGNGASSSNGIIWRYDHHIHRQKQRRNLRQDPDRKRSDSDRAWLNGVAYNQVVPHSQYSSNGEAVLACCGIDTIWNERILDIGSLERREAFGLGLPGANLGPRAFERTAKLFSGGADLAYGLLLRTTFAFTPAVHAWNQQVKSELGIVDSAVLRNSGRGRGKSRDRGERRRLTKDPAPDDDSPPLATAKTKPSARKKAIADKQHKGDPKMKKAGGGGSRGKHVREHAAPRLDSGKAGRQELPADALALHEAGKTTVKSSQGTSVGPLAGGTGVQIIDAGGADAVAKAIRAGAAPADDVKSAQSPEVQPLVQRKPKHPHPGGVRGGKNSLNPQQPPSSSSSSSKDHWAHEFAGNLTALAEAGGLPDHTASSKRLKRQGNGIGEKSDGDFGLPDYTASQTGPLGQKPRRPGQANVQKKADELLSKLYATDSVGAKAADIDASEEKGETEAGAAGGSDSSEQDFVLAVHLRHMARGDTGEQDKRGELACIRSMLELHVPGFNKWQIDSQKLRIAKQKATESDKTDKSAERAEVLALEKALPRLGCTVLVASDRPAAILRTREAVAALGCSAAFSPRYESLREKRSNSGATRVDPIEAGLAGGNSEHGPFRDGVLPIADLELLSHADAFIGSGDDRVQVSSGTQGATQPASLSTYSLLLASLIATNARNTRRIQDSPQFNILTSESAFVRYLPGCGVGFGSYRVPAPPMVEPLISADKKIWASLSAFNFGKGNSGSETTGGAANLWQGAGNGHYEPTDCPFFSWNRQCVNEKIMGVSDICNEGKERAREGVH